MSGYTALPHRFFNTEGKDYQTIDRWLKSHGLDNVRFHSLFINWAIMLATNEKRPDTTMTDGEKKALATLRQHPHIATEDYIAAMLYYKENNFDVEGAPKGKGGVIKKHANYADIEAGQLQLGNVLFTKAERSQHKIEARARGNSVQKGKVTPTPFDEAMTSLSADDCYQSFFYTHGRDAPLIQTWLKDRGLDFETFHASFINFCYKIVRNSKNLAYSMTPDELTLVAALHDHWPTNASQYIGAMQWYYEGEWATDGPATGIIEMTEPGVYDQRHIEKAQTLLYMQVFSKDERKRIRKMVEAKAQRGEEDDQAEEMLDENDEDESGARLGTFSIEMVVRLKRHDGPLA
ncbi:hypothetical protein B0A49_06285 [Cryomyces minteri]|uniref:Uncharacterized protein n=1 Tax=Cryomyces minteri TaxID=331657 RepID=A0A4U0WXX9_9PEZI|nr:hypothetical protein B0A49_06285 [Cryomyces minteri]